MKLLSFDSPKGISYQVMELGEGPPLVYFHGAGGLMPTGEPLLDALAKSHRVLAPYWPGYGTDEGGEELLEDMLDFSLHGWDVIDALGLEDPPVVVGHSMGGMIAAEMACLNPAGIDKLVLIASAGLWIDEEPIPDLFAMLPFELAEVLFYDPEQGEAMLTGGLDFNDVEVLKQFLVLNARRLGTAGKILFPIPNRRLSKRLYRMTVPTLLVWGRHDRLVPPVYAERFQQLLPNGSQIAWIEEAGHMAPYEQSDAVAEAVRSFVSEN